MSNTALNPARLLAVQVLLRFEKKREKLSEINNELITHLKKAEDRRLLLQLTNGVLRNRTLLEWVVVRFVHGGFKKVPPAFSLILSAAAYEIFFIQNIPAFATVDQYAGLARRLVSSRQKQVNAVLRKVAALPSMPEPERPSPVNTGYLGLRYSFPNWLVERWVGFWGMEFTESLLNRLNQVPTFDIRVDGEVSRVETALENRGIGFQKSEYFENSLRIENLQNLLSLPEFGSGQITVQDESAQIPVRLLPDLQSGLILDACAAPGTKFRQLTLKYPRAVVIGLDNNLKRLKKLKAILTRQVSGQSRLVVADARHLPFRRQFDLVLVDAPCSGSGVVQKHPDIRWRRSLSEIGEFSRLQDEIMESVMAGLASGGTMVYSTCSIDPDENEQVIRTFLKRHPEMQIRPPAPEKIKATDEGFLRTFPHTDQMDGSFAAVLKKTSLS